MLNACEQPSYKSNKQIVMLNQRSLIATWYSDQCPHAVLLSLGWLVTVSVVPIMDGNSGRMTFLPMHLKHLFLKAQCWDLSSPGKYGFVWLFYGDYQKQNAPRPNSSRILTQQCPVSSGYRAANYARLIDANIDLLMPSPFIRNPLENSTG